VVVQMAGVLEEQRQKSIAEACEALRGEGYDYKEVELLVPDGDGGFTKRRFLSIMCMADGQWSHKRNARAHVASMLEIFLGDIVGQAILQKNCTPCSLNFVASVQHIEGIEGKKLEHATNAPMARLWQLQQQGMAATIYGA
jgi:hypothetical protein